MKDDISQVDGTENKNIVTLANSWGATNAAKIASWFKNKYHFRPRIARQIEGVAGFPVAISDIGPAFVCKNYYSDESHLPTGEKVVNEDASDADMLPVCSRRFSLCSSSPAAFHMAYRKNGVGGHDQYSGSRACAWSASSSRAFLRSVVMRCL